MASRNVQRPRFLHRGGNYREGADALGGRTLGSTEVSEADPVASRPHGGKQHNRVTQEFLVLQPDRNQQAKPYQVKQFLRMVEAYRLTMEDHADE